jgi:hypothetical protein
MSLKHCCFVFAMKRAALRRTKASQENSYVGI